MKIAGQTETNVQYDTRSHHLPPKNQKQLTSILVLSNFSCFFSLSIFLWSLNTIIAMRPKFSELISWAILNLHGIDPSLDQIDQLDALHREIYKLSEEEKRILHEEPHDVIKNLGILRALRAASEIEPRSVAPSKSRIQKNKAKAEILDGAADSPGPSLNMGASAAKMKGSSVRSGSVPSTTKEVKEPAIKVEEGAEGSKGPYAEKAGKFILNAEVAYKQAKMKEDGSQWIQCNIISITEVGNKKRSFSSRSVAPCSII